MYAVVEDHILEKDSGHKIYFNEHIQYLNVIARKLNLGSGFQGFTPLFMCRPISAEIINNSKDI